MVEWCYKYLLLIISSSAVKVSEINTIYYGKCLKFWASRQFHPNSGEIGVNVVLQMLDRANHSVKVYFNREETVTNLITGFPGDSAITVKPRRTGFFELGCVGRENNPKLIIIKTFCNPMATGLNFISFICFINQLL